MPKATASFWLYILECDNGSYYTGYTTNLTRRYRQHVDGTANVKYTRSHQPVRIAQCWRLRDTVGAALKVEKLIKTRGRPSKDRLVREPALLREIATDKFGRDLNITPFDPQDVEHASRRLRPEEVKTADDPFPLPTTRKKRVRKKAGRRKPRAAS